MNLKIKTNTKCDVHLLFKPYIYELKIDYYRFIFANKDIRNIKIGKKFNTFSIINYFVFLIITYLCVYKFNYNTSLLLQIYIFLFLIFSTFIYKPIYYLNLTLDYDYIFIETTEKELFLDFKMLNYFYIEELFDK
jgi:hypothetical protein